MASRRATMPGSPDLGGRAWAPLSRSRWRAARAGRRSASCLRLAAAAKPFANDPYAVAHAAPYEDEEQRDVEHGEDGRREHSADDRGTDCNPAVRPRSSGNHQREHPEDEGKAGHQDRTEADSGGFDD